MSIENEDLCTGCGLCCMEKVEVGSDVVINPKKACRFLRKESDDKYPCFVYESRYKHAPWCLDAFSAYENNALPKKCPYVKVFGEKDYKGCRLPKDEHEENLLEDADSMYFMENIKEA